MDAQLLVSLKRTCSKFQFEDYTPEDHLLMLVASGSFDLTVDGQTEQVLPGEAVWFHRGQRYLRKIRETAELYLFRFAAEGAVYAGHHIRFRDQARIHSTLGLLQHLDTFPDPRDFSLRSALFRDLLTLLSIEQGQALFETIKDPLVSEAVRLMGHTLHQSPSMPRFCEKQGISYVQFCRRFKAVTGHSPTAYLQQLRLRKACTMLTDTELPIHRIAAECGFENQFYFSNFFRKQTCTSPSEFRKNAKTRL